MKKLIVLTLILTCLLLLPACGKKTAAVPATDSIVLPHATTTPTPTPPPDVIDTGNSSGELTAQNGVSITVNKTDKTLVINKDGQDVETFAVRIGSVEGAKDASGDNKTPEGTYYICSKKAKSDGTHFIGISYPNITDAQTALDAERIDQTAFDAIKSAIDQKKAPPGNTALGGDIGFSPTYEDAESTKGNIALKSEDLDTLWDYVDIGVSVKILP